LHLNQLRLIIFYREKDHRPWESTVLDTVFEKFVE
jgi:hypothetical protein